MRDDDFNEILVMREGRAAARHDALGGDVTPCPFEPGSLARLWTDGYRMEQERILFYGLDEVGFAWDV